MRLREEQWNVIAYAILWANIPAFAVIETFGNEWLDRHLMRLEIVENWKLIFPYVVMFFMTLAWAIREFQRMPNQGE